MCETVPEDEDRAAASEVDVVVDRLRTASQQLYDAIQRYLMDVADSELPPELVAAFDAMEAAWRRADVLGPR